MSTEFPWRNGQFIITLSGQQVEDLTTVSFQPLDHNPDTPQFQASVRQLETLLLRLDGATNEEIAELLGVSEQGIRNHMSEFYAINEQWTHYGNSETGLTVLAYKYGLLQPYMVRMIREIAEHTLPQENPKFAAQVIYEENLHNGKLDLEINDRRKPQVVFTPTAEEDGLSLPLAATLVQLRVLQMRSSGMKFDDIAAYLSITPQYAQTALQRLMDKNSTEVQRITVKQLEESFRELGILDEFVLDSFQQTADEFLSQFEK